MSDDVDREVCRLVVIAPTGRADLVLPASVPLADLLPAIGERTGLDNHGLLACRPDGTLLDTARTPAELGLRHGELIVLRTPESLVEPYGFDDPLEAVAASTATRDAWQPAYERWAYAVLALLGLLAAAVALPAVANLVVAVVALLGAVALSRREDGGAAAVALGAGAVACGASGGATLVTVESLGLLIAASVAWGLALTLALAVTRHRQVFVAIAAVAGGLTLALAARQAGASPQAVAAVTAVAAYLVQPLLPGLALRWAGIMAPTVPQTFDDATDDYDTPPDVVAERTPEAHRHLLTALITANALVAVGIAALVRTGVPGGLALGALLGVLLLLRARLFRVIAERLVLLIAGAVVLVATAVGTDATVVRDWPSWLTSVIVVAAVLTALAVAASDAGPSPSRRRLAALTEMALVITVFPILLWATGLYEWIRLT